MNKRKVFIISYWQQKEIEKQNDAKIELDYMKLRSLEQEKREQKYKERLNRMNKDIFDHGQNQIKYLEREDRPFPLKESFNV